MKKIIYGLLVLIGGVLICSNFMVDSSNMDHKKVSASGTACRWISESGYGVGPFYVIDNAIDETSISDDSIYADIEEKTRIFDILPCNNSLSDNKLDGYLIYQNSTDLYDGYLGIYNGYFPTSLLFLIEDGKATKYSNSHSEAYSDRLARTDEYLKSYSDFHDWFSFGEFSGIEELYGGYANGFSDNTDNAHRYKIPTDINNDGKWIFTCVCAEY